MNIGNMYALFLLLLIPLILLLHIILRRMEAHKVSSLLIWERVQKKRIYRFPTILILLLQIIFVVLMVFSLAQIKVPFTIPLRKENSVLIIDNSASMNVVEEGKSRLEDAKEKAINVIKGSSGDMMILTSSKPPQILSSYTNNREELIKTIQSISLTDLSNGVEEAMKIASASVTPSGTIIMISDGAFNFIPSETDNFKFIRAGRESDNNAGITDYFLREKSNDNSFELYASLTNFSTEVIEFKLNIFKGEDLIETAEGKLNPEESRRLIFNIDSIPESEIRAELLPEDLLMTDNYASTYISSNKKKRILLITPGNFFLEKALESIPGLFVETYTGMLENNNIVQADTRPVLFSSSGIPIQKIPDSFDVVIYDRIPPLQKDEIGRFIFIDVIPSGLRSESDKIQPQGISISKSHLILDSVDFSKVAILKAWPPLAGPQIQELVSGGNTGLLYVLQSQYLKFVYLPFDLTDSDFPLRASFPIFINNAIDWLSEGYSKEEIIQHRTGDSFLIGRADPDFEYSEITDPLGQKIRVKGNYFDKTLYRGLYRLEYADELFFGAVNLNNSDESNISSRFPEVTEEDREEKTGEYKFPITMIFLFLSLLLLAAEWLVQEDKW